VRFDIVTKEVILVYRECMVALGLLILVWGGLAAQPVGTVYDLHLRYDAVGMIELVPGVEVPADMWPDNHVVTIGDLVGVGVSLGDATAIVDQNRNEGAQVPCTWSRLKQCAHEGIPMSECCGKIKASG
jgi:hypothetical protein